jgi:hypothetical protein
MSKRLQVVFDDAEYRELQKLARKRGMTVSDWVRRALARAREQEPVRDAGRKIMAVREAARHAYPAGDIDQMLAEIERGYSFPDDR